MSCDKCYNIHEAQKCGKTQNECLCSCHNYYTGTWTGTGDYTGSNTSPFIYHTNISDTSGATVNFTTTTTKGSCIPEPSAYASQPRSDDPAKDHYCPKIENHECICGGIVEGQQMHSAECCNKWKLARGNK